MSRFIDYFPPPGGRRPFRMPPLVQTGLPMLGFGSGAEGRRLKAEGSSGAEGRRLKAEGSAHSAHARIGADAGDVGVGLGGFIPNRITQLLSVPPSQVIATLDRVNASYEVLQSQVSASGGQLDAAFRDGWAADKRAWDQFYAQNRGVVTIATAGSESVLSQAEQYRLRLVGWNSAYESVTGRKALLPPTGEEPGARKKPDAGGGGGTGLPWWATSIATLALVGGIGWVGYSAWQAYSYGKAKKRYLEREVVPRILESRKLSAVSHDRVGKVLTSRRGYSSSHSDAAMDELEGEDDGYDDEEDE